jgi:tetratricopeptide (TPR) repeat protein
MYHGYSFLWNGQKEKAFENFLAASDSIEGLIKDNHVAFLIYIFDLVVRHDGTGYEDPLLMILQHLADMAKTVYDSEDHPIYLIALWLKNAPMSRAWLAESTLRKLLDFFQDSIGYFHPETIALLQTFATALLNRMRYAEAAVRFQQLVDAFETTQGKNCYEVCYALRSTSEAYFHMDQFPESLQALKAALERSESLPRPEEREIYVRCLRAMAEISNKLGRREEAIETMQHVVDSTREAFGAEHAFSHRARMHLKSIQRGDTASESAIPPMVYRLGRGGSAAKYVWVSRSSPTRLDP